MRRSESFNDRMARVFWSEGDNGPGGETSPKTVTFQVTENCNLRCTYCYQGCKSGNKMTYDTAKKVIDQLLASDEMTDKYICTKKIKAVIFDFIGGEPTLEIDLIDKIMDYFIERAFLTCHPLAKRYMISMSTNGTTYFTKPVQDFIKKWGDHLSLSVSIDGNKKLHDSCRVFPDGSGSYDIAIAAAKDLISKGVSIGSKMTIAPGNVQYLCEAVIGLIETGYREINLNCVYEEGWTIEHARVLYEQLRELADYLIGLEEQPYVSMFGDWIGLPMKPDNNQNWCGGTGCMLAVDYQGKYYPCLRYMGSSLNHEQEPYEIGDLENGIMNTPVHKERVEHLASITRRSQSTDECFNCPVASGCSWCSAYNYQVTGDPNKRVTYICVMHKARVLANARYWNKLYRKESSPKRYPVHLPKEDAVKIVGEAEYNDLLRLAEEV